MITKQAQIIDLENELKDRRTLIIELNERVNDLENKITELKM